MLSTKRFILWATRLSAVVAAIAILSACTDTEPTWSYFKHQATLTGLKKLGFNQNIQTIKTSGDPKTSWRATIVKGDEWASFNTDYPAAVANGKTGDIIYIYISDNDEETQREFEVTVKFNDEDNTSITIEFSQLGHNYNPEYVHPTWGEQPDMDDNNPNYIYKTYYTTLAGKNTRSRNYSVCFDTETKVSRWVAYPVHSVYTSSRSYTTYPTTTKGRTNAWAFDDAVTEYFGSTSNYNTAYTFVSVYDKDTDAYDTATDPIIPQACQQNISSLQASGSPYSGGGAYGDSSMWGLNRGHMLPSASRYSTWETNAQTFYATNMMPQNGDFNQNAWGDIEGSVRGSSCNDTLYVVVGTLFEPGTRITSRGRDITVPSHCYKLLLRTKSGKTGKSINEITEADELISIGFLFENSSASKYTTAAQAAVSVAEIEERAGFKFFRNIDPEIADRVKAQCNIKDWPAF